MHVVHLSSRAALDHVREAKARRPRTPRHARTTSRSPTREYDAPDPPPWRGRDLAAAPPGRGPGRALGGLAAGALDLIATDHVPDRMAVEKAEAARGVPFDQISNGAPGIETLLTIAYCEGVAKGRLTVERMVDLLATSPARLFGLERKGAIEPGRDADIVLFDPRRDGRSAPPTSTTPATTRRTRAWRSRRRPLRLRPRRRVIRDGAFVGPRGAGQFVERGPVAG